MRNPVSRFAYSRSNLDMKRSSFDRTHDHKTTLSAGKLYPIFVDEVLPGDTFSIDLSSLVRMSTPIHPVMDNAFLDTYFFFVPNRIIWDHWKEFMGESPSDPYENPIEYSVPVFKLPVANWSEFSNPDFAIPSKSILDYMGIPPRTNVEGISQLPVRAFCKIWNEWFRDQNLQNAIALDTGDSDLDIAYGTRFWNPDDEVGGDEPDAYVVNAAHGGNLPPVNKYHDYFTSALLKPQKGDPVPIPLSGFAPVYGADLFYNNDPSVFEHGSYVRMNNDLATSPAGAVAVSDDGNNALVQVNDDLLIDGASKLNFGNVIADLNSVGNLGVYSTISDLRFAFQLQKFLEADNRGGTRYREILKQHFGVTTPDASVQVPEFLGGKRTSINISQVIQTSSTDETSPQGNTAAYSLTNERYSAFTKSFTEHGYIIGVACVRTEHTYCDGVERMWNRRSKFDYYFPEFANISEQPILFKELYNPPAGSNQFGETGDEVFGFQEAWAEYRYKPNRVSAEFRPSYPQSLDVWHYGDDYAYYPELSDEWIRETRSNIDRTLAVDSTVSDQFICDFYFKMKTVRCMPIYSIPGLADHH